MNDMGFSGSANRARKVKRLEPTHKGYRQEGCGT